MIKDANASESKVKKFFKAVFVHNIGFKLLALGLAIAMWLIVTGF